ncbi:MAG: hypothetical protein KAG34_08135 [Cocleimonas sp.]|nr:hypothetical protein [Cocleimonas sp.]
MKWKALLWTLALSVIIFFTLVYLGMKFQWVDALQDKKTLENEKVALEIPKTPQAEAVEPKLIHEQQRSGELNAADTGEGSTTEKRGGTPKDTKAGFSHSLIGEETQLVDFTGMPLEMVVEECRRISKKVGIPVEQFNQSVNECATRNFQGRTSDNPARSRNVQAKFRKQCKDTIPEEQQALFSPEEMKLLIDECVADLHKKKN